MTESDKYDTEPSYAPSWVTWLTAGLAVLTVALLVVVVVLLCYVRTDHNRTLANQHDIAAVARYQRSLHADCVRQAEWDRISEKWLDGSLPTPAQRLVLARLQLSTPKCT